jgi:hypothetical protein
VRKHAIRVKSTITTRASSGEKSSTGSRCRTAKISLATTAAVLVGSRSARFWNK